VTRGAAWTAHHSHITMSKVLGLMSGEGLCTADGLGVLCCHGGYRSWPSYALGVLLFVDQASGHRPVPIPWLRGTGLDPHAAGIHHKGIVVSGRGRRQTMRLAWTHTASDAASAARGPPVWSGDVEITKRLNSASTLRKKVNLRAGPGESWRCGRPRAYSMVTR